MCGRYATGANGRVQGQKRGMLKSLLGVFAFSCLPVAKAGAQSIEDITLNVYKEPTCGCCVTLGGCRPSPPNL